MTTMTADEIKSRLYRGRSTVQRFLEKVRRTDNCWFWDGFTDAFGYGRIKILGNIWGAHRLSWVIHHGDVPSKLYVLHRCDNPSCVNPNHLFLGTYLDNVHDCMRKGRSVFVRGSKVGTARFTEKIIQRIKRDWSTGRFSKCSLARKYKTSDTLIRYIVTGKYWAHVSV